MRLVCRAALATLDIFKEDDVLQHNAELASTMQQATASFSKHPHVAEVRQQGMILAIEMVKDKSNRKPYPWQERRGLSVYRYGLENGALLRPLGNVMYFMPPYIISEAQIRHMTDVAWHGIQRATYE